MRLTLSFLFLAISYLSFAQRDTTGKIGWSHIEDCIKTNQYTYKELANHLVGSWKLTKQYCYWRGKQDLSQTEVIVSFNASGSYTVTKNSKELESGNWKIQPAKRAVHVKIDNPGEYLNMTITVCGDKFYFSEVGSDGCECLYLKVRQQY